LREKINGWKYLPEKYSEALRLRPKGETAYIYEIVRMKWRNM
jgi:hypothetical protein